MWQPTAGEVPAIGRAQKRLETGFTLLTVCEERSAFRLSFRTVQRTGHPYPALSRLTPGICFSPPTLAGARRNRVRTATASSYAG